MKLLVGVLFGASLLFGMVDINHADEKELSSLNGVGKAKAAKIVEYRNTSGCFKTIEDLSDVKGIGKGIFTKNKTNIKVTPCK